jgi:hypothetical protein
MNNLPPKGFYGKMNQRKTKTNRKGIAEIYYTGIYLPKKRFFLPPPMKEAELSN